MSLSSFVPLVAIYHGVGTLSFHASLENDQGLSASLPAPISHQRHGVSADRPISPL